MSILWCNGKITVLFLSLALLLTSCGREGNIAENSASADELIMQTMKLYDLGASVDFPERVSADISADVPVFYYEEQNLEIWFYVNDAREPAVVWINEEKYPFSYGFDYSPMESEAPCICVCDINMDEVPDVLICGTSYRTELRQDVYLSDGNGGYRELGDVTWNKNETEHSVLFCAEYQSDYRVYISAPDWNIEEEKELDEDLTAVLVSLGIYDDGRVTEYGAAWELDQLQGISVRYVLGEDGQAYLYYDALIEAGYSEYDIGYGFRFIYMIHDSMYELENILFFDAIL